MAKETQVREIRINVDTKGNRDIKALADQMSGLNKNTKSIADSMKTLRNSFLGFIGAIGVQSLVGISDSMQLLGNRIKILTTDGSDARDTLGQLTEAANRSKTDVGALGDVYARLAAATGDLGIKTSSLISLTETLQNTFRLSGSGTQEAYSAAVQLSQGFASGQLRGQELRSVLEANVEIGKILSKTFGVTRGELYKLAEAGQLTAGKVLKGLIQSMDDVNARAEQLGLTFQDSLVIAFNNLKLAVFDINKFFGLSGAFGKGIKFISEQTVVLTLVIGTLATTILYTLIPAVTGFATALVALTVSNPFTAGLSIILGTVAVLIGNFENLELYANKILAVYERFNLALKKNELNKKASGSFFRSVSPAEIASLEQEVKISEQSLALYEKRGSASYQEAERFVKAYKEKKKAEEDLRKLMNRPDPAVAKEEKLAKVLARINQMYLDLKITASEYFDQQNKFELFKLNTQFRKGKIDLEKYLQGTIELEKILTNRAFATGAIDLQEFNEAIDNNSLQRLQLQLDAGTISLIEYNKQVNDLRTQFDAMTAVSVGVQSYLEGIGSVGNQVAGAIKNTFTALEDAIFEFTKTGEFNFKKFTQSILDDLTKIIIKSQIIGPLAQGLLNFGSGTTAANDGGGLGFSGIRNTPIGFNPNAHGNVYDNGLQKFAKGGVVSAATTFGYGKGGRGLMGEDGPEGILPLKRGRNGDLGVQATSAPVVINIVNNSQSEITTSESTGPSGERTIEVLIKSTVQKGFADGSFDKSVGTNYGLKRKGA